MKYIIKSGDTLSKLAEKYYGDKMRYMEIVRANPFITNPDLVRIGEEIEIPLPPTQNNSKAEESSISQYVPYVAAAIILGVGAAALTKREG